MPRVGDVRSRWLLPSLAVLCAVTFVAMLYVTSFWNFFYDEWDFVTLYRPGGSASIFAPHNEHWSTIPILLWKGLFAVFGIRMHLLYEAAALLSHAACVLLMFELVRRRSGDLAAFAAALTLLVLGSGATNIIWAFQVAWTISIACGLGALILIDSSEQPFDRRRAAAISILLLFSLMSSGIGLGFLIAAGAQLLVDRARRPLLVTLVFPTAAYVAWFLAYGATHTNLHSSGLSNVQDVVSYVLVAITASAVGLSGFTLAALPPLVYESLLAFVLILLAWNWYAHGGISSWEIGLVAGMLGLVFLIALVRVRLGPIQAADQHYVYVGVVFLLPLVADAIKHLSWRPVWRPILGGLAGICVLNNAVLLVNTAVSLRPTMQTENAELRVVELFRGAPDLALDEPLDARIMPQLTASTYYAAVDELGSPLASTPRSLDQLDPSAVDHELLVLFGHALSLAQAGPAGSDCSALNAAPGAPAELRVPSGHTITIAASQDALAYFTLGFMQPPTSHPIVQTRLRGGVGETVRLPDTGKPIVWRLGITTDPAVALAICGSLP